MPIKRLKHYLDERYVKYVVLSHSTAYTAQEIAQSTHISGKEFVKTVMVKMDDKLTMVVLPAACRVDFGLLRRSTGIDRIELATEDDFARMFPDCEIGAMPPFGSLYSMEVVVAKSLQDHDEIAFNAGTHREIIKMRFSDFVDVVRPRFLELTFVVPSY